MKMSIKISALFSPTIRKRINETLFSEMVPCKTDVGIILGAKGLTRSVAQGAVNAFNSVSETDRPFNDIILTGGNSTKQMHVYYPAKWTRMSPNRSHFEQDAIESHAMKAELSNLGVDKHIVHTDDKSKNTGQNFKFIAPFMKEKGYKTATIICLGYQQTRARQTAELHMSDVTFTTIGVFPWQSQEQWVNRWHRNLIGAYVVLDEYRKIDPDNPKNYYYRGFAVNTQPHKKLHLLR